MEEHISNTPPPGLPRAREPRGFMDRAKTTVAKWFQAYRTSRFSVKSIRAYPSNVSIVDWSDSESMPCQHSHREKDCVLYMFKGLLRGFIVGFALKSCFAFALLMFSRKIFVRPGVVLHKSLVESDALHFGKFMGIMGFVYRSLQCLFCKLRGKPGKRNSVLAAFISGAAILLDTGKGARGRRSTIALYLICRFVCCVCCVCCVCECVCE